MDAHDAAPIDPWYRSGGGCRAPTLAASVVGHGSTPIGRVTRPAAPTDGRSRVPSEVW